MGEMERIAKRMREAQAKANRHEHRELQITLDPRVELHNRQMREEWFDGFWRGAVAFFGLGIIVGGVIAKLVQWWG